MVSTRPRRPPSTYYGSERLDILFTERSVHRADDYNGDPSSSDLKAMLVAKVALGKSAIRYRTDQGMTAPPFGYHSVSRALIKISGGTS